MQAATKTYDRLAALPNVTPAQLIAASRAYNTLGDELGQNAWVGLTDLPAALASYRTGIDFDNRALSSDPGMVGARRDIGTLQLKIGNVELETDPAQALKDIEIALQEFDGLPEADRKSLTTVRDRAITERKKAMALEELGEHAQAVPLFEEALQISRQLAAADPKDLRAINDVSRVLQDAASSDEDAANPAFGGSAGERRREQLSAEGLLEQSAFTLAQMLKLAPPQEERSGLLAYTQVRIGSLRQVLHLPGESEALSERGLAVLKDMVEKDPESLFILDLALEAILKVEPASLRDPRLAVKWAERGVALSHRKIPRWLLSLAQAYRDLGQIEKGRAAAREGLALLPILQPGATKPRIRRLLEIESRAGS